MSAHPDRHRFESPSVVSLPTVDLTLQSESAFARFCEVHRKRLLLDGRLVLEGSAPEGASSAPRGMAVLMRIPESRFLVMRGTLVAVSAEAQQFEVELDPRDPDMRQLVSEVARLNARVTRVDD